MTRTRTFQGLAPEDTRPRLDSESPKSGIRLVQPPLRVPRPSRPEPAVARPVLVRAEPVSVEPVSVEPVSVEPAPVPAPPPSRRAAVKPRGDRAHITLLPPAPPIPALPPEHERLLPKPSQIQFRSMITTAQDWVLVKPSPPLSPTFGMALRSSLHSLPAFLPPRELLGDVPPVTTDRPSKRVSEGEMEIVRSHRAMQRRVSWALAVAGFTLAIVAALVVIAFSRG